MMCCIDWNLVSDCLPPEPEVEENLFDDFLGDDYIVMIEGATKSTWLSYLGDGHWFGHGQFYRVYAWAEFPQVELFLR